MPVLAELARWGYQWAWSKPRGGERIDIGAIFRLTGGLVDTDPEIDGELEVTVTDGDRDGGSSTYTVTVGRGLAFVVEEAASAPKASVSGDTAAWVRAFAPTPDLSGLTITGDRALADSVISQLAQADLQETVRERSSAAPAADSRAA